MQTNNFNKNINFNNLQTIINMLYLKVFFCLGKENPI
jgi:hypothetical protein